MAKGNTMAMVGSWAFIIGVIIAVIMGLVANVGQAAWAVSVLILLGLIVGFLNVSGKESGSYLLAAVSLVIVSSLGGNVLGQVSVLGPFLSGVLGALLVFTVPATIIVALKAIYSLAKNA